MKSIEERAKVFGTVVSQKPKTNAQIYYDRVEATRAAKEAALKAADMKPQYASEAEYAAMVKERNKKDAIAAAAKAEAAKKEAANAAAKTIAPAPVLTDRENYKSSDGVRSKSTALTLIPKLSEGALGRMQIMLKYFRDKDATKHGVSKVVGIIGNVGSRAKNSITSFFRSRFSKPASDEVVPGETTPRPTSTSAFSSTKLNMFDEPGEYTVPNKAVLDEEIKLANELIEFKLSPETADKFREKLSDFIDRYFGSDGFDRLTRKLSIQQIGYAKITMTSDEERGETRTRWLPDTISHQKIDLGLPLINVPDTVRHYGPNTFGGARKSSKRSKTHKRSKRSKNQKGSRRRKQRSQTQSSRKRN